MVRFAVLLSVLVLCASTSHAQSFAPFANKIKTVVDKIDAAEVQSRHDRSAAEAVAQANQWPITSVLPNGNLFTLQKIENGLPRYYSGQSVVSAQTLRANQTWSGGSLGLSLNGSGQTLGVWDESAVRSTHQEFVSSGTSRVTQGDGNTTISMHATHVSGTMIAAGVNGPARGMSNAAQIRAYDWNNDQSEMRSAAAQYIKTSNHSYGLVTGWIYGLLGDSRWVWMGDPNISATTDYHFGFYTSQSQQWDMIANDYPYYLICKAAGNDRGEGPAPGTQHWVYQAGTWTLSTSTRDKDGGTAGFDCIEGAALSKNIMTVGAVYQDTNYTGASSVQMTSFSGWGPTDDGRIKPDVVSMGVSEYSCYGSADNAYAYMSGTSMATPGVTGAIGLLLQHHANIKSGASPMRSSTVRGLLIHSADEAGSAAGPDYKYGWGLINIGRAATQMSTNAARAQDWEIQEVTLQNGQSIDINGYSAGTAPVRVTIAWNDPAGTPTSASLNPTTAMLVNDCDLRVNKGATSYAPYILDPANPNNAASTGDNTRDNVEQVYIDAPSSGTYTIHISHKGSLSGGSQSVSVLISGLQPPGLIASAGSPVSICNGSSTTLQGSVTGGSNPSYAWTVDGQNTVLSTALSMNVNPTASTTYRFTVTDGAQTASSTVTVSVVDVPVASASADVTINAGQSTTMTASTGSNANSTQYLWTALGSTTPLSTTTSCTVQPTANSSFVLRASSSNGQCNSLDTVVVTVNAVTVTANAGVDKTVCAGSSVTVNGSGTGTGTLDFKWIDLGSQQIIGSTQQVTFTPTASGSYAFRVTDSQNNVANDTMVVTVLGSAWTINAFGASASPCKGSQVTYTVDAITGMSYQWTCSGGTIASGATTRQVSVNWGTSSAGSLTVVETYASCSKSRTQSFSLVSPPSANFSAPNTCIGQTKTYTANDASGVSYAWSLPSGGGTIVSGGNARTVTITWTASGQKSIKLTEVNSGGCSGAVTKNLTICNKPSPSVQSSNSTTPRVGQTRYYSVSTSSELTNSWSVTKGYIIGGQGTGTICVQWTSPGMGGVTVMQTNTTTSCSAYVTRSVSILTAQTTDDGSPVTSVGVYPNPASNIVHLDIPVAYTDHPVEISVLSLTGQHFLKQTEVSAIPLLSTTLDISSLACGMYVISVQNGEQKMTMSFVKE